MKKLFGFAEISIFLVMILVTVMLVVGSVGVLMGSQPKPTTAKEALGNALDAQKNIVSETFKTKKESDIKFIENVIKQENPTEKDIKEAANKMLLLGQQWRSEGTSSAYRVTDEDRTVQPPASSTTTVPFYQRLGIIPSPKEQKQEFKNLADLNEQNISQFDGNQLFKAAQFFSNKTKDTNWRPTDNEMRIYQKINDRISELRAREGGDFQATKAFWEMQKNNPQILKKTPQPITIKRSSPETKAPSLKEYQDAKSFVTEYTTKLKRYQELQQKEQGKFSPDEEKEFDPLQSFVNTNREKFKSVKKLIADFEKNQEKNVNLAPKKLPRGSLDDSFLQSTREKDVEKERNKIIDERKAKDEDSIKNLLNQESVLIKQANELSDNINQEQDENKKDKLNQQLNNVVNIWGATRKLIDQFEAMVKDPEKPGIEKTGKTWTRPTVPSDFSPQKGYIRGSKREIKSTKDAEDFLKEVINNPEPTIGQLRGAQAITEMKILELEKEPEKNAQELEILRIELKKMKDAELALIEPLREPDLPKNPLLSSGEGGSNKKALEPKKQYRKWWAILAGLVAAGAIGLGLGLGLDSDEGGGEDDQTMDVSTAETEGPVIETPLDPGSEGVAEVIEVGGGGVLEEIAPIPVVEETPPVVPVAQQPAQEPEVAPTPIPTPVPKPVPSLSILLQEISGGSGDRPAAEMEIIGQKELTGE